MKQLHERAARRNAVVAMVTMAVRAETRDNADIYVIDRRQVNMDEPLLGVKAQSAKTFAFGRL